VKHPLGAVVAVTLSATGSALAADLPLRAIAPAYAAQELSGKQIRASIVSARGQRADRRTTLAVTATLRDNHVLEFLRWKEQFTAANSRAVEPSR
jgi:hypothetical protein